MKSLLKIMLTLGSLFALTFIIGRLIGILTVENIQYWMEWARQVDTTFVAVVVVLLLFADLFIAVPTLTITILAGYFLGFPSGAAAAFTGMSLAAASGYGISWMWGQRGIALLIKDPQDRADLTAAFETNGPVMIMLSRAVPIVTEVTACMAGATHMRFARYCMFFAVGTIPYVIIAAYAGSISSVEDPTPAIFAVLSLNGVLWVSWAVFKRHRRARGT
ncbi:MAG: VTT domain-containing protein [Litoreibacter sp.]|uniref:TVP38/TMEM64 family protein n=1 Tax=Litoreibacter sp. TaxID=1969459 RepID=UPI003299F9F1